MNSGLKPLATIDQRVQVLHPQIGARTGLCGSGDGGEATARCPYLILYTSDGKGMRETKCQECPDLMG